MSKHRAATRTELAATRFRTVWVDRLDRHEAGLDRACAAVSGAVVVLVGVAVAVVAASY